MNSRFTGVLIGQIIGIVIVCMISTFIALVSFGGIAGVAMATKTEQVFQFVAPLSCPNGTVNYEEYRASYNQPGESNFYVECVAADGTTTDVTMQSIGYALLGFYLACFLPLCVPGGLVAIVAPMFFLRGGKKTNAAFHQRHRNFVTPYPSQKTGSKFEVPARVYYGHEHITHPIFF
jgi:hypothetical protein